VKPARIAWSRIVLAVLGSLSLSFVYGGAFAAETAQIPNFAPTNATGWLAQDDEFIQPPSGPGPVKSDPAHPYISFYKLRDNPHPAFRVADLTNPILQPWVRERLKAVNERSLSGRYLSIPKERCWPVGVPAFLLLPATPVYFVQSPGKVAMIWMQDHQVRHVYLDVPHSPDLKPSWFGESVGRYEGDALVVVEVNAHIEDPGAFKMPWNAIQRYRRMEQGPLIEMACAENNGDHFHQDLEPMPRAEKPDF
jgi:hypothetical protein